ncbi:MAG: GIY-YIG nuclease family protein [Actinomycetota bacterium]|nr:GIY-YIG nuclease family protein [Actinomycetota bacterium]
MYYVYILKLSNGIFYVGSTRDLKLRIQKHSEGGIPSTAKYRPHRLVWYSAFSDREKAILFEKYLKTASGKAFRNKRLVNKKKPS